MPSFDQEVSCLKLRGIKKIIFKPTVSKGTQAILWQKQLTKTQSIREKYFACHPYHHRTGDCCNLQGGVNQTPLQED